jgi:hypothetical protein
VQAEGGVLTGGMGGGGCCSVLRVMMIFFNHACCKNRDAAQSQQHRHSTGSTRAFRWLLGEGMCKQRGGISTIGGWGQGRQGKWCYF